jgi:hypothetical protein
MTSTRDWTNKTLRECTEEFYKGLNSTSDEEQIEWGDEDREYEEINRERWIDWSKSWWEDKDPFQFDEIEEWGRSTDKDRWETNREEERKWEWTNVLDPNASFRWDIRGKWRILLMNVHRDLLKYIVGKYIGNLFCLWDLFEDKFLRCDNANRLLSIDHTTWTSSKGRWIAKAEKIVPNETRLIKWRLSTEYWNFFDGGKVCFFEYSTSIEWKIQIEIEFVRWSETIPKE